jgi:hypothetical protein
MFFIQILVHVKVEVEVVEPHFEVNTKVHMVHIINMKVNLMEVDLNLKGNIQNSSSTS